MKHYFKISLERVIHRLSLVCILQAYFLSQKLDAETRCFVQQTRGRPISATAAHICGSGQSILLNSLDAWQATCHNRQLAK